jgi:hypothetical protein
LLFEAYPRGCTMPGINLSLFLRAVIPIPQSPPNPLARPAARFTSMSRRNPRHEQVTPNSFNWIV